MQASTSGIYVSAAQTHSKHKTPARKCEPASRLHFADMKSGHQNGPVRHYIQSTTKQRIAPAKSALMERPRTQHAGSLRKNSPNTRLAFPATAFEARRSRASLASLTALERSVMRRMDVIAGARGLAQYAPPNACGRLDEGESQASSKRAELLTPYVSSFCMSGRRELRACAAGRECKR